MTKKVTNKEIDQEITVNVVFFIIIGTMKCQDGFLNHFQSATNDKTVNSLDPHF